MQTTTFMSFLNQFGGPVLTLLAVGLAALIPGIGSARGTGLVGESSAGLIAEDPEKFGKALIMQVIPGTQGLYGFVIGILILVNTGFMTKSINLSQGCQLLMASLPIAIVGYRSAIYQGKTAAAGIQILAKRPEKFFNGVIFAVIVETYALLAFVISFLMLNSIKL